MSAQVSSLVLVNLEAGDSFIFRFFPEKIEHSRRANWEPQRVTTGTQPLLYANREPKRLTFPEVWLDNSATGDSVTADLEQLYALQNQGQQGAPPKLLAQWGERQERVVLEEVRAVESHFTTEGNPRRALLSLTLIEIQDDGAAQPAVRPQTAPTGPTTPSGQAAGGRGRGPQP